MKGLHKRSYSGWEPVDDSAKKIFKRYKFGELVDLEHKAVRNIKWHRKYFGIINLTFMNQDLTEDKNEFREAVQIHAGFWHYQKLLDGSEVKRSDSISFAKMDDITFGDLYNKVFTVCLHILGCKSEALELELLKFD